MNTYIADASVGTKWFVQEPHMEMAAALLESFERKRCKIIVPEIFYVEVASAFWKQIRRKLVTFEDAVKNHDQLIALSLERYSDHKLSDVALENAVRYKISVYDALYISLAEIHLAPLVTSDEVLIEACRAKGFEFIESLEEMKLA